jgi:diguanylate cyclase (GGDEF)-like protein/PAS domain S-box-containing protein
MRAEVDMNSRLSALSGEYLDAAVEAAFLNARFRETVRQGRLFFITSAVLNTLFFMSDWRFYGEPHFWVAIPSRAFVVLISLVCLCLIECVKTPGGAQRVLIFWQACVAVAVGLLVTSHSEVALFAVIVLPAIYYLALPTSFIVTSGMGVACSVCMLVGYIVPHPDPGLQTGLILAMVTTNSALTLIVSKGNRLRRLEWAATQATLRANEELDASRAMLEKIFMAVPIPLIVTEHDTGRLLRANRAAVSYFGGLDHVRAQQSIRAVYAEPSQRDDLIRIIDENGHVDGFEVTIAMPDGTRREMLLAGSRVELDGKDCVITGGVDISARKAMEARLEELATHDSLTGVMNRTAFFERASIEIGRARRSRLPLSVIMIDLDYFKLINDAFGHAAGDLTLKAFADLCRSHLRPHDCIGRLGGEEFACVLAGAGRAEAMLIAERLRLAAEDLAIEGAPSMLRLTISIGVSDVHGSDEDISASLARADLALYGAKMRGRNKVVLSDQREESFSEAPRERAIASARS